MNEFKFKKKYGQNFIKDENLINKIVNSAEISKESLVIEIGPGMGALTTKILDKCKHGIIYEIDTELKDFLEQKLKKYDNYELIFQDFLTADIKEITKKYNYKELLIVANLPYYITTPIIKKIIEEDILAYKIVIMIQKEVADRFSAKVNTKDYSSLTVFLNYHYEIKKLFNVSKNMFYPKPDVDSSVILMSKKIEKEHIKDINVFNKFVKDCFKYKRKNLRNNLKEYDLEKIEIILEKYNLSLNSRAENLPLSVFIEISNSISI